MNLTLSLVAFRGMAPMSPIEMSFSQPEVTLGRGADSDFVIDDPDRFCSRQHAICYLLNGELFLEDVSSSYTLLNERERLERGHKRRLQSGDRIGLGEAVVQVSIASTQVSQSATSGEKTSFSIDDFFSGLADDAFSEPSHFEPNHQVSQRIDASTRHPVSSTYANPSYSSAEVVERPSMPFSQNGDYVNSPVVNERHLQSNAEAHDFDFSDLAVTPDLDSAMVSPSLSSAAAQSDSAVSVHRSAAEKSPEITAQDIESPSSSAVASAVNLGDVEPDPLVSTAQEVGAHTHYQSPSQHRSSPQPQGVDVDYMQYPEFSNVAPALSESMIANENMNAGVAPASTQSATLDPIAAKQIERGMASQAAVHAFIKGMGIEPAAFGERDLVTIMGVAGSILNGLTGGVMSMLQARGEVKSEFGMDMTQIAGQKNNPLKFSVSTEDALLKLLVGAQGYLGAEQSIEEGVRDTKAHQIAVMSGMQAALVTLLDRFEPTMLEARLEGKFVLSKKAKYWELYKNAYQQLVGEAEDNFHVLFGDEFSRVYLEQIREFKD